MRPDSHLSAGSRGARAIVPRLVGRLTLIVVIALTVFGCGGEEQSAFAHQLDALCIEARSDIEALGLPAEAGFAVIAPWAERGRRLAADVGKVEPVKSEEADLRDALAASLEDYYAGLKLAAYIYESTKSSDGYVIAVDRATASLEKAEQLATQVGAHACAVRPFADTSAPS